jgi:hypothetical protein
VERPRTLLLRPLSPPPRPPSLPPSLPPLPPAPLLVGRGICAREGRGGSLGKEVKEEEEEAEEGREEEEEEGLCFNSSVRRPRRSCSNSSASCCSWVWKKEAQRSRRVRWRSLGRGGGGCW